MAKIVVPETEKVDVDGIPISEGDEEGDAETITEAEEDTEEEPRNLIDAAAAGAADGLKLASTSARCCSSSSPSSPWSTSSSAPSPGSSATPT
jgi:nucleoside permease NupC